MPFRPLADRFWEKVDIRGPDECWPWTACVDRRGYGRIGVDGKKGLASQVSLVLDGRPRPTGGHALHSCHNPTCVNPRHLRWGTHAENMRDKIAIGNQPRGEKHGIAKLTEEKVRAIRAMPGSNSQIAKAFNVTPSLIHYVQRRKIWRHVA